MKLKDYNEIIEEKRRKMNLDPKIWIDIEIQKDKSKNPFKYHYLKKKKHLSDVEIFNNYKSFNFSSDPKLVGNFYLEEVRQRNKINGVHN